MLNIFRRNLIVRLEIKPKRTFIVFVFEIKHSYFRRNQIFVSLLLNTKTEKKH